MCSSIIYDEGTVAECTVTTLVTYGLLYCTEQTVNHQYNIDSSYHSTMFSLSHCTDDEHEKISTYFYQTIAQTDGIMTLIATLGNVFFRPLHKRMKL